DTLKLLCEADEDQFYLSNISPLGVPFNTVKGSSALIEKERRVDSGVPGAPCVKKYLVSNTEYTKQPICAASVQFQKNKIREVRKNTPDTAELKEKFDKIVDKVCLCVGLGNSALAKNELANPYVTKGFAICPGPNLAYFSKISSLKEMVDHIYGKINIIVNKERPSMFIKELNMYIDYMKSKFDECSKQLNDSQVKYLSEFQKNLNDGINYYKETFSNIKTKYDSVKHGVMKDIEMLQFMLNNIELSRLNVLAEKI
ncbi:MAG TPA: hypothetical protein VI583_16720, partial [Cyclobacteriaceae bacterium]|nr:hypothetical protein [Cyclobacteriaceae bacterium]